MSATDHDSDADGDDRAVSVSDLPPSAKLVYKVLEYEGSLTQDEIAAESRLCPRTVRYALGKLETQGLVASRVCLDDARQSKYWIAD
ncbi:MarR family transcriptional regulator [Halopiger djelfimassiliensis]|uniref:MarR family transcriptional regulator n=1 Tax=Halopiger djelfimassiliensis TaxID=1293047 RepID=UPI000677DEDE|nr:winged helix-turn-helix transcriptional regulator [Halopiger djelfimassiliensis]